MEKYRCIIYTVVIPGRKMMKRETIPNQITDKIMELCNQVVPGAIPVFIEVVPHDYAIINECFNNVDEMVRRNGGEKVNGWSVWQWANIMVEVEAHAIWRSPSGRLIDITPHINQEKQILFLPDERLAFNGYSIDSIRMPLTDSPLIAELIQIKKWLFSVTSNHRPNEKITLRATRQLNITQFAIAMMKL
jgi:hypothetical protein